jgi:hypothetical protein
MTQNDSSTAEDDSSLAYGNSSRPADPGGIEAHAISPELVKKLLARKHPGFSAHVGEPIAPTDKLRLEDTAAYLVRNPSCSASSSTSTATRPSSTAPA